MDMPWVVEATYEGDRVDFLIFTDSDDLAKALPVARAEAHRIFAIPLDKPGVHVHIKRHGSVL